MYYTLDTDGQTPLKCHDALGWAKWFESADEARVVDQTMVGAVQISTVFLGLDHAFAGGSPLLWETMVFGDSELDEECERYGSFAQAKAGHWLMVERVRQLAEK